MTNIILALILSCPATKIDNWTKTWTKQDEITLGMAKKRCAEIYPDAPCVKFFRKKDAYTYNVICGYERKKK